MDSPSPHSTRNVRQLICLVANSGSTFVHWVDGLDPIPTDHEVFINRAKKVKLTVL